MLTRMAARSAVGTLCSLLLGSACTGDEVRLLEDDWRSQERLRRMDLVVEQWTGSPPDWVVVPTATTVDDIDGWVEDHCRVTLEQTPAFNGCDAPTGPCDPWVCNAQRELCRALTFRDMAEGVDDVVLRLSPSGADGYRLRRQDVESRVALWQASQYASMLALGQTQEALLNKCGAEIEAEFTSGSGVLEQSTGELLASTLVEALENGEHAAHEGASAALGIADRDRAAISNLGLAARLSWFDANLSRLIAVQTHVGGLDPSALGSWSFAAGSYQPDTTAEYYRSSIVDAGIGSQPECTGGCATALETIRFSGAPFAQILATGVSLDTLVLSHMGPRLRERLPTAYDIESTASAAALAAALGITVADLEHARAWMRHEAEVLARPKDRPLVAVALPPSPDGAPRMSDATYDPTTMARPTPPPSMHYLTAARNSRGAPDGTQWTFWSAPTDTSFYVGAIGSPRLPPLRPERAYLFAYAHAVAREALAAMPTSLPGEARGVLATLTQTAAARRALEIEVCNSPDTSYPGAMRIRVVGLATQPATNDDFLLVEGTTNLRCAQEGYVEGQPCTGSFGALPTTPWAQIDGSNARASRRRAVEWVYPPAGRVSSVYVVRRRSDRAGGPGAYEPIAGIPLIGATGFPSGIQPGNCTSVPYDFVSGELASGTFAMTGDLSPAQAACGDDLDLNAPLPLEDIVIDDGDLVEDSFQHHLRIAAEASAHADLLGQQLIQSGLEMDRQATTSIDGVQELCGASINVDELFSGPNGELAELIETDTCNESADDRSCSSGFECVGTLCVRAGLLGAPNTSQRRALMECLGLDSTASDATVPIVALADAELCLWRRTGAPEILCDGAAEAGSCPFPVADPSAMTVSAACGAPTLPGAMGENELVLVTNNGSRFTAGPGEVVVDSALLDLTGSVTFEGDDLGPPGSSSTRPSAGQCNAIRNARGTAVDADAWLRHLLTQIRGGDGGPFFSFENVQYWAGRIGWRAYPLDFSEITLDGVPWADAAGIPLGSTGFPFEGFGRDHIIGPSHTWNGTTMPPARAAWPCAALGSGLTGAEDSLFLEHAADCTYASTRAPLNHRMGRAVATLAALAGLGLSELRMPAYYEGVTVPFGEGRPRDATDYTGRDWRLAAAADYLSERMSGWVVHPTGEGNVVVWTSPDTFFGYGTGFTHEVSSTTPMSFLNFGARFADNDSERAGAIAATLWDGMQGSVADPSGGAMYWFYDDITIGDVSSSEAVATPLSERNLFLRALLRRGDQLGQEYLRHGRNHFGESDFNQLSGIFGATAFDLGGNSNVNLAHLFANNGTEYGLGITRRDLLDAMELMCEVAASVPNADVPPPQPREPVVTSMADLGAVQLYARRVAARIDDVARRQVVQDVPLEVVNAVRGEPTAQHPGPGAYGDLVRQLRIALRNLGNAPRDIAAALRDLSTALDVMRRNEQIFDRQVMIEYLGLLTRMLSASLQCLTADAMLAGAACGVAAAVSAVDIISTDLAVENLASSFQNQFDEFLLRIRSDFDVVEAKQAEMQNAADDVRRILAQLRSARIGAQSALAQAIFADSNAAGRHYPVNTAMRRVYDINLQRYRAAHQAAQRLAIIARMAVEQRFGVNLEEQMCASLVEDPYLWAADVCNTSGINYADLRNPDADVSSDAIRQMFVGDYVRRLAHYAESYRFDSPYSSGEDLMVISVRDDLLRPRGRCVEESGNLLGMSNDLASEMLPDPHGELAGSTELGWHVPAGGCTGDGSNCVAVDAAPGPRVSVHSSLGPAGPVPGRIASAPPRGFEVTFAPGASDVPPATTTYTDGAALVQQVVLPAGNYRLSWYERGSAVPKVDARTAVMTPSSATRYTAAERAMTDGWVRKFIIFSAPPSAGGTLYYIGVFPQAMEPTPYEQSITVAGLQLESVTGTPAGAAFVAGSIAGNEALYGPPLFTETTAPGWAAFDDCATSNPSAFRNAWNYRCTRLCSGGFSSEGCTEGEEPQTYCYWETVFSLDEERLVGRGDRFGGGFAFGNFNYRTGDIAVNVVGTGVRNCEGVTGDACYTTAGIPFSLSHGPPGLGDDGSAYTVRTHTGTLHPVHLFRGQIESGRALAAERYLTNPVSSADAALIHDYQRTELRGRPMSGTYRLILWDVPGFDFHRVEDVQILWRYRYFTRTGSALVCAE